MRAREACVECESSSSSEVALTGAVRGRRRPLRRRTSTSLPSLSSSLCRDQSPRPRPGAWPARARSKRRCSGGSLPRPVSIGLRLCLRRFILMLNHSASSNALTIALYPRLSASCAAVCPFSSSASTSTPASSRARTPSRSPWAAQSRSRFWATSFQCTRPGRGATWMSRAETALSMSGRRRGHRILSEVR